LAKTFLAIGLPIIPSPINPTRFGMLLSSFRTTAAWIT
jgi:hypothetical protein